MVQTSNSLVGPVWMREKEVILFNCLEGVWIVIWDEMKRVQEVYFIFYLWNKVILGDGVISYSGVTYEWDITFLDRIALVKIRKC